MSLKNQSMFRDLNVEAPDPEITEIESCCVNCLKNGTTRLLLTRIPFYKEVVLMSFSCEHCGFANNEIQPGGEIESLGRQIKLSIHDVIDLNRRIVKSDWTSVKITELDFEIPAQSQKGEITTLEGIIDRSIAGLEQDQAVRQIDHPDAAKQIDDFIDKLRKLKNVETPFTVELEDISGNVHVENPNAPHPDNNCIVTTFTRTTEQDHQLGIFSRQEIDQNDAGILKPIEEDEWKLEELHGEVLKFDTACPECRAPCQTNMKVTSIPHFKDVVIMATNCDSCGWKTNEVKSGGGIEEHGLRFEVKLIDREDMSRDVLKSDTCRLRIPELDCEVGAAALSGRFTTVEGLLEAIRDQLSGSGAIFRDSESEETTSRMGVFMSALGDIIAGNRNATLILDDPAGNSYVQALTDDGSLDERLKVHKYERNHEQNEDLGLNDIRTENYETG